MPLDNDVTSTDDSMENQEGAEAGSQAGVEGTAGGQAPQGGPQRGADGRFQGSQGTAPAAKMKYRIKSKSGGEEEVEADEETIRAALSAHREVHHRLRSVAEERKKLEAERAAFQKERETLASVWKDPAALRKYLHEQVTDPEEAHRIKVQLLKLDLDERKKSPEQRELEALRQEREARQAREKEETEKAAKEKAEAEIRAKVEALRPGFVKQLTTILDLGGIPATERTLSRMAEAWRDNKRDNLGMSDQELADYVKEELDGELDARLGDKSLSDEAFEQRYPQVMERAHRILVEKIKKRRSGAAGGSSREGAAVAKKEEAGEGGIIPPRRPLSRAEERQIYGPGI
jgi:hypothetical protein